MGHIGVALRRIWSWYRSSSLRGLVAFAPLLFPQGWERGTAFLVMFAIFGALFVRGRRAHAQGGSSVGLIAAAVLVIAVQEFFVSSYTANTLIGIPVLLCLGAALMLNRDLTLGLSRGRKIRFGVWCAAATSIGVAGTVAAVHRGRARATDAPWTDYLRGWELVCIVLLLLVAIFGGFWVFRKSTAWDQVLAWSLLGGMLPFLAVGPTLVLMGEAKVTGVVGSCIGAPTPAPPSARSPDSSSSRRRSASRRPS